MAGPRLQGLIDAAVSEIQDAEVSASPLLTQRGLSTAYGDTLDIIGNIVGMPRGDRSDAAYRNAIEYQVTLNSSHGEPDTILVATQFYIDKSDSTSVAYVEKPEAKFALWFDATPIPDNIYNDISRLRPAGVGQTLMYNVDQTGQWLMFEVETGYWDGTQRGMGYAEYNSISDNTGAGRWAELLTGSVA